jgi:putative ABC transport system permease protein
MFAAPAVALAAVGLYGLMSYSVTQRTNEIGVRMPLGAKQSDLLGMILLEGMKLAIAGLAIGIASSLAFGRCLASMPYGVKSSDPLTMVVVSAVLVVVSLLSDYIPARRAAKVDPMVALRYE